MNVAGGAREKALTAVLVANDRALAESFLRAAGEAKVFQILAELKGYPAAATLEMRLRQMQPDVVLLDLASDFGAACALIPVAASLQPPVQVVGLHHRPEPDTLIRCFRAGAAEFLSMPFDAAAQREAAARIWRLRQPEPQQPGESGVLVAFSPVKPGAGASTIATQFAFAVRKQAGRRVLLVDLDTLAGAIAFHLKLAPTYSVLDAIARSSALDPGAWSAMTVSAGGIDVLAAPDQPVGEEIDSNGLHEVLEFSRLLYDWVIVDLPSVFHRLSLFVLSEADAAYLVSTPELPSLHMARRAVGLLGQLGFSRERFQILVNRLDRRADLSVADMEKIFSCPVFAALPDDPASVHRMVTRVEPMGRESEFGRSLEQMVAKATSTASAAARARTGAGEGRPVLSEG
ncbi:MAG: AAA family ATPase [Bryobacteraceae bacterium]|nr:AAA family ATPase [Bryobacteraceae bacterium]MCX7605217.1 AAA family ATPase [Bryobacteraceae bacterium]